MGTILEAGLLMEAFVMLEAQCLLTIVIVLLEEKSGPVPSI